MSEFHVIGLAGPGNRQRVAEILREELGFRIIQFKSDLDTNETFRNIRILKKDSEFGVVISDLKEFSQAAEIRFNGGQTWAVMDGLEWPSEDVEHCPLRTWPFNVVQHSATAAAIRAHVDEL